MVRGCVLPFPSHLPPIFLAHRPPPPSEALIWSPLLLLSPPHLSPPQSPSPIPPCKIPPSLPSVCMYAANRRSSWPFTPDTWRCVFTENNLSS